jgi:hypothetical protein
MGAALNRADEPVVGFAAVQEAGLGLFRSSVAGGIGLAIGVRLFRWRQSVAARRDRAGDKLRTEMGAMNSEMVSVFFYGLFMDESLLASKGVIPANATVGYVDGYGLRIGRRATLVPDDRNRAYGVLMTVRADGVRALYSDESVADYVSESVSVVLPDGTVESAVCYNLPERKLEGANPEYAKSLLILAGRLDLADDYLQQIREQAG